MRIKLDDFEEIANCLGDTDAIELARVIRESPGGWLIEDGLASFGVVSLSASAEYWAGRWWIVYLERLNPLEELSV